MKSPLTPRPELADIPSVTASSVLHAPDNLSHSLKAGGDGDAAPMTGSRIPVLDGLRGLAILIVMANHLFVMTPATALDRSIAAVLANGSVGVDLFFVLSGFLITGILYDARGRAGYFRNFYARRILRIFPLYYAVLFIFLVVLPRVPGGRFGAPAEHPVWYWTFLANFPMGLRERFGHVINVAWSLCIEEQFYLVWPAIVLVLGRASLMRVCAAMILTSAGARLALALVDPTDNLREYCWTICRMDGLAVGAWIALAVRSGELAQDYATPIRRLAGAANVVGVTSVAAIVALIVCDNVFPENRFTSTPFYTAIALLFGALLIRSLDAPADGRLGRLMRSAAMRTFGKYSYALYLIHLPIGVVLRDSVFRTAHFPTLAGSPLPGQILFYVLSTGVSLTVAWGSWHLLEKHFLLLKRYFPMTPPSPRPHFT